MCLFAHMNSRGAPAPSHKSGIKTGEGLPILTLEVQKKQRVSSLPASDRGAGGFRQGFRLRCTRTISMLRPSMSTTSKRASRPIRRDLPTSVLEKNGVKRVPVVKDGGVDHGYSRFCDLFREFETERL
jgi:hypothetical protein